MTYDLGLRCAICGSIISDDNPDGIGFGCRHILICGIAAGGRKHDHQRRRGEQAYLFFHDFIPFRFTFQIEYGIIISQ